MTQWADRAAELYERSYARKYRQHDEALRGVAAYDALCRWLRAVSDSFGRPIDVLDLGCGTGRYFCALANVASLVGLDASAAMLDEASHPIGADSIAAKSIQLIQGDLLTYPLQSEQFDLVYSIGVLAEHTPLNHAVVANVHRWLRRGGRFAFTTVHPASASVPPTLARRTGRLLLRASRGEIRRRLRDRLSSGGMYADESTIDDVLAPAFIIESLTRLESEAHLHCLCVARKVA